MVAGGDPITIRAAAGPAVARDPLAPESGADPVSGRDLAAFVVAVETATVHGAADALCLTQSAVSKRIQALERRTGARLLVRGRLGVRPTAAGRLLYPEAKQALAALERVAQVAALAGADARRDLRLAASYTIGEFLLPGWLAAFRAQADLRVQVDVVNSRAAVAELRRGIVDVAFVEGPDVLDGLDALVLARDELVVVVGPRHRWARRAEIAPSALAGERYLARERDSGARAIAAARLAGHLELQPALETASVQALKRAVLDGGYTVVSEVAVRSEVAAGQLCALRVRGVDLGRELRAVRRRTPPLTGPAKRLWAWLEARRDDGALEPA